MDNPYDSDRVLKYHERVTVMQAGHGGLPVSFDAIPTNRCNLKCGWCYYERNKEEADTVKLLAFLKEVGPDHPDGRVLSVKWGGGGEPTLHPDLPVLVQEAARMGYVSTLLTNGTRLAVLPTADFVTLVDGLCSIRVSLDAAYPGTYSRVHGCPETMYDTVMVGLERVLKYKPALRLSVGYIVTEANLFDLMKLRDVLATLPGALSEVAVRVNVDAPAPVELISSLVEQANARYSSGPPLLFRVPREVEELTSPCISGFLDCGLSPDGTITHCNRRAGEALCRWDVPGEFARYWGSAKHLKEMAVFGRSCYGCRHVGYTKVLRGVDPMDRIL